jgi:large subunit ribosomal protein L21
MQAVIRTGGKQYLVAAGQTITIERLTTEAGQTVAFEEVLMTFDKELKLGDPIVKGAKVEGTIVEHNRAKKVIGIKFHNKVRYRRKFGHRQHQTEVTITKITA